MSNISDTTLLSLDNQRERKLSFILFGTLCLTFLSLALSKGVFQNSAVIVLSTMLLCVGIFLTFGKWDLWISIVVAQFLSIYGIISRSTGSPPIIGNILVSDVVFCIVLFMWILQKLFQNVKVCFKRSIFVVSMFIFICMGIISAMIGISHGYNHWRYELRDVLYFIIFFVVLDTVRSKKQITFIVWFFIFAVNVFALQVVILEYFTALQTGRFVRMLSHNLVYMQIVLQVIIALLFSKEKGNRKLILILSLIFPVIALLVSFTRGYWIGFVVGALIIVLLQAPKINLKHTLGYLAILTTIILLVAGLLVDKREQIGNIFLRRAKSVEKMNEDPAALARFAEVALILEQLPKHPYWGAGLGSTILMPYGKHNRIMSVEDVHNGYFKILFKQGYIGLFVYFLLIAAFYCRGILAYRKCRDPEIKSILLWLLASYAGLMVTAVTSAHIIRADTAFFVATGMAIVERVAQMRDESNNLVENR